MAERVPAEAAIVVAGGRSTRFGSDKLQAQVGGRTLLLRTIEALSDCRTVVIVSAADHTLPRDVVRVSEYPRWGGPCAGIAAGVAALPEGTSEALIVSADLARPADAIAALHGMPPGVLADEAGNIQWLLARVPLPALRNRLAQLQAARGVAGIPVRALIGDLDLPIVRVSADVVADVDEPRDLDKVIAPHSS